jgi:quaternary ammonium compound-resistance protein SugE
LGAEDDLGALLFAGTTPPDVEQAMAWFVLFVAGLCEVGWAVGLKYSEGFTRPIPTLLTGVCLVASMILLAWAMKTLPLGTAYTIWTGIGAVGAITLGVVLFKEPLTAPRVICLSLILAGIVGLKLFGGAEA